ncbi:uncharacterized protein [Solanum lycopersicum]|uniref:uncharacterized protein isoform X1 n=1 Tax=Solanum lycopersicum TaxID=4081 RepID=UPI0008FEC948|nr:uncharacterized protein LOC101257696 isoform X1 [Solanum lycopersicum]
MPYKNSSEVIAAMFSLAFYFLPCLKVLLIKISVASTCTFDCTRNGRRVFQLHCLSKRVVGWRSSKCSSYGEGNCYYQGGPSPVIPPPTYVAPLPRKNRGFLKGFIPG